MEIIEYKIVFIYNQIDEYIWSDNFQLSEEWEILRLKKTRTIQKAFMDRSPYTDPPLEYTIALYSKNKWYCLKNNEGILLSQSNKKPIIPNLKITSSTSTPFLSVYKFDFDFHVMITLLHLNDEIKILEFKRPSLNEAIIIYNKLKINLYHSLFSYKGDEQNEFKYFCEYAQDLYREDSKKLLSLYSPSHHTHKSIDFKTWYKAKRENQQKWPLFSTSKLINSIEFPHNSGIYYYYPDKYVGLAKRNDDNTLQLIPKIYRKDHSNDKNTYLYHYLNNIEFKSQIKIPHTLRKGDLKYAKYIKKYENEPSVELSYSGSIIEMDINPQYYMYRNILIKKITSPIIINKIPQAQILNKNNEVDSILINNKWEKYSSPKLKNIITLPYNYKQIIHDYNKLGKLKKGPLIDLSHIGIVDENTTDIITWPDINDLYISKTLETKRLITFKFQKNVTIKIIYD